LARTPPGPAVRGWGGTRGDPAWPAAACPAWAAGGGPAWPAAAYPAWAAGGGSAWPGPAVGWPAWSAGCWA